MKWHPRIATSPAGHDAYGVRDPCFVLTASRKRRVLIVDDEENILTSLRRLLRREPYELLTAHSGEEALQVMQDQPAHLVVSDYRMPGMTGTGLLQEVQTRWPETVRIILSGYSEVKAIIDAINKGAIYKFISKPWNDEEIKLHIRRALEQYDLEAENRRLAREIARQNELLQELNAELEQRASDAATGLDSVHDLLDFLHAGVITVDQSGLIVGANRRAVEIMAFAADGLIGVSAADGLPHQLDQALLEARRTGDLARSGRLVHDGRALQWRAGPVGEPSQARGTIIAVWEDVR